MKKETKEALTEGLILLVTLIYLVIFHNFPEIMEYWRTK